MYQVLLSHIGPERCFNSGQPQVQPQEAAGVELPWNDARQLVEAIVLSRVGTPDDAVKVLDRVGFRFGTAGKNCANLRQSAVALQSRSECATSPSKTPLTKARPTPKHCRLWRPKGSCGGKRCHTA